MKTPKITEKEMEQELKKIINWKMKCQNTSKNNTYPKQTQNRIHFQNRMR